MKAPILLKKYGNRRLYDARQSGYVTLEDVETMLRSGDDVQVVDAKSGEDLTNSVLVQIILEREETREALPTSFLKQVVRLGGTPLGESLSRQLLGVVQGIAEAQKGFVQAQRDLGAEMQKFAPYSPFSMLANPFAAFAAPPPRPAAPPPAPSTTSDEGELRQLREDLHETQALVKQLLKKSQEGEPVEDKPRRRPTARDKRRRARG